MLTPEQLQRLMVEGRRERALVVGDLVAKGWRWLWRALRRLAGAAPHGPQRSVVGRRGASWDARPRGA